MERFGLFWNENNVYSNMSNSWAPIYYASEMTATTDDYDSEVNLLNLTYLIETEQGPYVVSFQGF
jgi:hypothetical protein